MLDLQDVVAPRKKVNLIDGAFVTSDHVSTHAILDTGASRCIIREKTLEAVKSQLPSFVKDRLKRTKSQIW